MSWNPVLDFVVKVKQDFLKIYSHYRKVCDVPWNDDEVYDYENASCSSVKYKNVVEYWVDIIDKEEYKEIISMVDINQFGDYILIRYKNYSDIYSQFDQERFWSMYDGFYRECRTVVIDIKDLKIVSCGFRKFFNINELPETAEDVIIDRINKAKRVEVSDKLDGSMMIASCYKDRIIMCSAHALNPTTSWRLQDAIKMLLSDDNFRLREAIRQYPSYSFIFECISMKDQHIVKYTKEQEGLYLIGVRNKKTGSQLSYKAINNIAQAFNIKTTKVFNKTFDEVKEDTKIYKSDEKEGYVLNIDEYFVKIKTDDFIMMHKTISGLVSPNTIIKNIADNTFDDFFSRVPLMYKDRVKEIADYVFKYIMNTKLISEKYFSEAPKENRREFMIWVDANVPKLYKGYVRNMYLGENVNYIKTHNGHYKKMSEMGYKGEYLDLLDSVD